MTKVFIYAIDISALLELDAEQIILDKIAKVKAKHPADLMRKNTSSAPKAGENKTYLEIKHRHRQG